MSSKNKSNNISSIQKDQEYLHSHNVRGILERLIADVIRDKPDNACEYMAEWALKQGEANRNNNTSTQSSGTPLPTA